MVRFAMQSGALSADGAERQGTDRRNRVIMRCVVGVGVSVSRRIALRHLALAFQKRRAQFMVHALMPAGDM